MLFLVLSLVLGLISFVTAQEKKDYSLFISHTHLSESQLRVFDKERTRLKKLSLMKVSFIIKKLQKNPELAFELTLNELKRTKLDYIVDKKIRAYRMAECAMVMARVIEEMPLSPARITKAQVKRMWRLNIKDVSRVMALCRKHPEDKSEIIERFKCVLRTKLALELAK